MKYLYLSGRTTTCREASWTAAYCNLDRFVFVGAAAAVAVTARDCLDLRAVTIRERFDGAVRRCSGCCRRRDRPVHFRFRSTGCCFVGARAERTCPRDRVRNCFCLHLMKTKKAFVKETLVFFKI